MIRRAVEADVSRLNALLYQVQAIHAEARPDIFKLGAKKYTDEELGAILKDDSTPIYVCEQDGEVVGYAFCIYQITLENAQLRPRKVLYLDDLCVDGRCRRHGIGRQLFQHVLQLARENGCDSVTLNVWSVNEEALRFYRKMGMSPLKTTMETPLSQHAASPDSAVSPLS